ncbi:MAG TPA: acyltransferase, partial [Candidatus Jeotgalibaca merdavium]|nr:acyltransferase [Candidatus Jeotgalibaca merdavium]
DGIQLSSSFNVKWSEFPSGMDILAQLLAFDYNMDITAGAFWSIVQEWRIALVIPFIAAALSRYSTKRVVAVVALTNWTLDYSFSQLGGYWGESLGRTNYYFIFFFIGAVLSKHIEQLRAIVASRPWVRMVSGILLPFLIPFQWVAAGLGIDLGRRDAMPVTALGIVLLLLVVMETPWLSRLFKQPIFLYLGKISFSLYLTHTTAIVLFTTVVGQFIEPQWALMLSPAFALGFAALWYTFVEERLSAVKWPKFQTLKKVLS